jgi:orotate phosphoribosyltransferase
MVLRDIIPVYNYIKEKCIHYGQFQLSSGLTVNRYFDMRKIMLDTTINDKVVLMLADLLDTKKPFNSIGGMETGAIPIITLLAKHFNKQGWYVRKTDNQHGLRQRLEGNFVAPALLVDDVVKTGRSIFRVEQYLLNENHSRRVGLIVDRICIIDRRDNVTRGSQPKIMSLFREEDF